MSSVESRRVADVTEAGERLIEQQGLDGLDAVSREALRLVGHARRVHVVGAAHHD